MLKMVRTSHKIVEVVVFEEPLELIVFLRVFRGSSSSFCKIREELKKKVNKDVNI